MKFIIACIFTFLLNLSVFGNQLSSNHFLNNRNQIIYRKLPSDNNYTDFSGKWRNINDASDEMIIDQDEDNLNIDETHLTLSGISTMSTASVHDSSHEIFFTQWSTDHKRIIIESISYYVDLPNNDKTSQKDFTSIVANTLLEMQNKRIVLTSTVYFFINGNKLGKKKKEITFYDKLENNITG
jgi:hypothetical protein